MSAPTVGQFLGVEVDLHIPQGADWPGIAFPILDADGQAVDLSACTAVGQIRKRPGHPDVLYSWLGMAGLGTGPIVLAGNLVTISVPGADSALWTFTAARYDVKLTNPAAPPGHRIIRVARGAVYVSASVTP